MITELESQMLDKIDQILTLDLSKLYPRSQNVQLWSGMSADDVEKLVTIVKGILNDIKMNVSVLETASPVDVRNFNDQLTSFIKEYNNQGLHSLNYDQIIRQHHGVISQLHSLNGTIKSNGIYVDLNAAKITESILTQKVGRFLEAEAIANTLTTKSATLTDAITSAERWLSTRQNVNGKTIEEQAESFYDMANEHKVFRGWSGVKKSPKSLKESMKRLPLEYDLGGSWFWLLLTFIFAALTGWATYEFVIKAATTIENIKVGAALLRIAGLIVPGYLTLFSSNQFLYHKRLYDNYMFKYSSMKTMNNLVAVHKEQGERVLDKGLDILFTEPRTKESSGKYDPQLINELIKMLRDQINK